MHCLRIENLPPDIRLADIDNFFRPFSEIVLIELKMHVKPLIAFVQFADERKALQAAEITNGYNYKGYTLLAKLVKTNESGTVDRTHDPPPAAHKHIKQKTEPKKIQNISSTSCWDRDIKRKIISDLGSSSSSLYNKPKCSRRDGYVFDNAKVIDPKNQVNLTKPLPTPILHTSEEILRQNVLNSSHSGTITTSPTKSQDVVIKPPANVIEVNDNLHRKQFSRPLINVVTQLRQKLAYSQTEEPMVTWDFENVNTDLAKERKDIDDRLAYSQTEEPMVIWNFENVNTDLGKEMKDIDDRFFVMDPPILNKETLPTTANDAEDIRDLNCSPHYEEDFQQSYNQLLNSNQNDIEVMENQKIQLQNKLLKYLNEEETSRSPTDFEYLKNFDLNFCQHSEEDIQQMYSNLFDTKLTFSSQNDDNLIENQKIALHPNSLKFLTEETSQKPPTASQRSTNSTDTRNFDFSQHFKKDFQQNASNLTIPNTKFKNIFNNESSTQGDFLENPIVRNQLLTLQSKPALQQAIGNQSPTFRRNIHFSQQKDFQKINLNSSENSLSNQESYYRNRKYMENQTISRDNTNFHGNMSALIDDSKKTINCPNDFTQLRQKLLSLQSKPTTYKPSSNKFSTTGFEDSIPRYKEQLEEGFKQNDIILIESDSSSSENSKDKNFLKSYKRKNDFNNTDETQNLYCGNPNFNNSTKSKFNCKNDFNLPDSNLSDAEKFDTKHDSLKNYKRRKDLNNFNSLNQDFKTSTKSSTDGKNYPNNLKQVRQKLIAVQPELASEIFHNSQGQTSSRDSRNNKKVNFNKDFEELELLRSITRNRSNNYMGNGPVTTRDNDNDQIKSNRISNNHEDYNDSQGPTSFRDSRNNNKVNFDEDFEEFELLSSISRNRSTSYIGNKTVTTRDNDIDGAMRHQLKSNNISNKNEDYYDSQGLTSSRNSRNNRKLNFDEDFEEFEFLSSISRYQSSRYIGNGPVTTRDNDMDEAMRHQLKSNKIYNKYEDDYNLQSEINSLNPLTKIREKLLSLNAAASCHKSIITDYNSTQLDKSNTNDTYLERTKWIEESTKCNEVFQHKKLSQYQGNNQSDTKITHTSVDSHNNSSYLLTQLRQKLVSIQTESTSTHRSSVNESFTNSWNTRNFDNCIDEFKMASHRQNDLNSAGPSLANEKRHPADVYQKNLNIQHIERGFWQKELNNPCYSSTSDESDSPKRMTTLPRHRKHSQEEISDSDFVTSTNSSKRFNDKKKNTIEESLLKTHPSIKRPQDKKSQEIKQPWFEPEMIDARSKSRWLFYQARVKGNWQDYKEYRKHFNYMTRKAKRLAAKN